MKAIFIFSAALFANSASATFKDHINEILSESLPSSGGSEASDEAERFAPMTAEGSKAPMAPEYSTDAGVSALMLSLWSLANNNIPPAKLLKKAGLNEKKVASFMAGLPDNARLTDADRALLRSSYTKDSFAARLAARSRYLGFISKFQEKFPAAAGVIPEILTVWGEARNLRGFDDDDSYNQQAKMATVIHVIRNRTEKRKQMFPGGKDSKHKLNVVTRRFQFSAFEPYDPNFSELALGPASSKSFSDLSMMTRNDQAALINMAKVISGLNRGNILLSSPLVNSNTYHYLTPELIVYSRENLAKLRTQIKRSGRRLTQIQVPTKNPQFITAVPRWSLQSKLIDHPPIKIKETSDLFFQTQVVSPSDFIYFWGIK